MINHKPITLRMLMPRFALFVLLSLVCLLANAADTEEKNRYYDVELVIFENLDPNGTASENWPTDAVIPTPAATVQLDSSLPPDLSEYIPTATFKQLPPTAFQLNDQAKLLQKAGEYRVLLHTAWRQPGLAREVSKGIRLEHYILSETAHTETTEGGTTGQDKTVGTLLPTLPVNYVGQYASLKGYVTVVLSRYLHLEVDLAYRKGISANPVNLFDTQYLDGKQESQAKNPVYYLSDKRRMRSKELHYIDHPVLGMLALITPYTPPAQPKRAVTAPADPAAATGQAQGH